MTIHHRLNPSANDDRGESAVERQIAAQVAALGGAITPSRRHRDRVLEQASDSVVQLKGKVRSAKVVIAMSILLVLVSPLIGAMTRVKAPAPQTAERANAAALRHAEASQLSFDWALVDVFSRFRQEKRLPRDSS